MTDELFFNVMLAASSCMIVTGTILAAVKTPADERAAKYRVAKYVLSVAVLVLGILNMVQIGYDPEGDTRYLGSCLALAVSFVQAMLFTMAVLVLIRPEEVTLRRVLWQAGGIAAVDGVLGGVFFLLPLHVFFYVYELCIVLYLVQLAFYTRWYVRCHRQFVKQISAYYEEEEIERSLRWLGVLFWAALTVGVLSLLMLIGNRTIDVCMTVALALYYAFLAASFINYQLSSPVILPAIVGDSWTSQASLSEMPSGKTSSMVNSEFPIPNSQFRIPNSQAEHPDRLMDWIERGGYLDTRKGVEDIARELEMSLAQFHAYFDKVVGEDFRTWRVRKRIEHAQQLMAEHPDWPMTRIAQKSGFNDRSWFYKQFQHFTGQTVTAYKKTLCSSRSRFPA